MTRLIAILMVISTGLLVSGAAVDSGMAGTVTRGIALSAADDFTVPPEWAGIWDNSSTSSFCGGGQISSSTGLDTLCAGAPLPIPGGDQSPVPLNCTGTVNATTVDVTCTGSSVVSPDCQLTVTIEYDVTRNNDESTSTVVMTMTYDGAGCVDVPPSTCIQTDGTGTRVAAAPGNCTQSPVTSASWGVIKTLYGE